MPTHDAAPAGAPCWIELFTNDTDAARTFYGDLFGWTSEQSGPEYGGYIIFSKDGTQVAGGMGNSDPEHPADFWTVYLASDDAAATVDLASANGGQVILAPMPVGEMGTMAMIADAGGAAVGVWQPNEHKGFGVWQEPGSPSWFELHTRDYVDAVPFYEAVFDWDTHVQGDTDEFRYTTLGEGDGQLAGVMDASGFLPEGVPSHWTVYFNVADADASVARVLELGGARLDGPDDTPYGRIATVADPTGSVFRLHQPNG